MSIESELRKLASPVVVEADDAIRSILAHLNGQSPDVADAVYRMLLMGAVGVLKQHGQSNGSVAKALRGYADMLERGA